VSTSSNGIKHGYRSGLEDKVARQLSDLGVEYEYEKLKISYEVHESRKYTPDFVILHNGIIVETKGRFLGADRKKHLLIKEQHPEKDIRFVFSNSKAKLSKGSPTSYADWCNKHGFFWADKLIPQEWLNECLR
jgi:hypothetical protein